SQYVGMGRELYITQPVFRDVLDHCDRLAKGERGCSLLDTLFHQKEELNRTRYAQLALFALEISLAELLRSWSLEPDVVLGHSLGQYAAAVVAGVLKREDGLRLVAKRAELMGQLPAGGAMAAVFGEPAVIQSELDQEPRLSLAADNGAHLVLSGSREVLEKALTDLRQKGLQCEQLNTSHAFHSGLMDTVLDEFEAYARKFEFRPAELPLICNLTGEAPMPGQVFDANYWRRQIREPVQFRRSIRTLAGLGVEMLI